MSESDCNRFTFDECADGQIYVSEDGHPVLAAIIDGYQDVEIQVGGDGCVRIDKRV